MTRMRMITPLKGLLNRLGEAISERRLLKALDRLEQSASPNEAQLASERLNLLLSRDPMALQAFIEHKQLEAHLQRFLSDPSFKTS